MTEQCKHEWIWNDDLEIPFVCKEPDCRAFLVPEKALPKLNATERLNVIYDSIDDYLAPVTVKGTTKDEYVPVEASTLAWWMDTIEDVLETK